MSSQKRVIVKMSCGKCNTTLKAERGKFVTCRVCGYRQMCRIRAASTLADLDALHATGYVPGPIQGELSEDHATRIRAIYQNFGYLTDHPGEGLEHFELSFMRHVLYSREQEVISWEKATAIFIIYMQKYPDTSEPNQRMLAGMILLYMTVPANQAYKRNCEINTTLGNNLHNLILAIDTNNRERGTNWHMEELI